MASLLMTSLFMASDFPDLTVAVFSVELCLIIMYHIKVINYCILIVNKKIKIKILKGDESESKINSSTSSGTSQQ